MSSEMENNGVENEGAGCRGVDDSHVLEQLNQEQERLLKEKECQQHQEPEEEVESYDERLKERDRIQKAIRRNQQREAELRMQAELEENNVGVAPAALQTATTPLPIPPLLPLNPPVIHQQSFPEEDAKTREERKKERDRIRKERDRLRKREIRANMDPVENERRKEKDRIRARLRRMKRDSLPIAPVQISSAPGPKSKKAIATIPPNVIPGETYGERRRRLERERKREVRAKAKIHALIQQTLQQSDQTTVQKPKVTEALTKRIKRVIDGMMTTVDEKNFAEEIPHYRHVKKKVKKTQCAAGVPNKYKELPLTLREEEQCAFMEMTLQQLKVEFEERKRRVFEEALDIEVGGQQSEQHNNNHNENNSTIDQQHLEAQYQAIQSQITSQQETMQFGSSEMMPNDTRVEGEEEIDSTEIQKVAVQTVETPKELVEEGGGEKIPEGWKDMLANEEEEDDGHLDIPRMFQTANVKVELVEPDYHLQELNPADSDKHWKIKTSLQTDRMQRRSKYRAESKIREFAEDEDNEDMQDLDDEYDSDAEAKRKHRQKVATSSLAHQKQQQQRREHIAVMGRIETQLRDLKCKWEKLRICWINIDPYSNERNELDKERRILLKKIRTEKEELYRLLVEYVKEKREKGKFLDDTEETAENNANGVSTIATNSPNKSIRSIALARREHAKLIRKQRERNEDRRNLTTEEQRQKRNAKAKLRKEMERIEYDVYNEVEAVIYAQTLDFPTLQKFEETFYKIPNQTAIDYWYNYLAAPKTRNELLEWRARLWEIMNKRRIESGTVPEGAAQPNYTPIPVTTEQSQIDFNNLKNLIDTSGNIIKDHLSYKRFYIYNSQKKRLEKKKQNQTEEEKIEQQNKLNAYLRKKYWKKKGVNIEFGAYVQPNIAKGMYNKKHGINEKIRGPRKPRKSKNHNETLPEGFKRKRRPGGGRKPKEPKLPQTGHSSQNNSYTPSSSAGIQYAGHPSNEAFSASFDNSNDDSGDGGWIPFQIPTNDSYYLDLDHQNYQNQHLQNSQQSQYHSQQQVGGGGQGHHSSQHAPRLQLVNNAGHFSQQVHGQHWTQTAAGDMHAVQFLPNSQINLIGHIAAAAASSAASHHHHHHHNSQYYTPEHLNQDYSSSASSVIEHHQRSHKKRGRVRGKKYNFKKTLDGVKNFARKREGIWQRKKRAPDGTEDAIAAFIETPAPLEKLIDKEMLLPKCTICDKVLSNDVMLQKHYKRWHAKDEKNRKKENGKTRASVNKKTSSSADPENDNKCIICNYKYMDIRTYTSHLKNMHFTKEGKDNMHPCPFGRRQKLPCGQREFGRKFIKEHMKKHHGKDLAESFVLKVHSAKEAKKSKAQKYLCLHCESDFLYYSDLVRHYEEAHGRKRYECQFCGIYLRTDDFFWDHVKLFHPETKCSIIPPAKNLEPSSAFRCTECFSEFSSNNHLTSHMEKGHKFPNTNKSKISNDSDDENIEATDEFCYIDTPYKCEICKHRYTELFNLRYHAVRDHGLYDYVQSAKEQGLLEETNLAADKSDVPTPISYQLAMPTRYSRASRKPKPNAMENTPSIPCSMCQAKITGTECHDYHKRYEKYIKRYCIPCNRMFCRAEILDKHNDQCHGISPDSVQSQPGTDYRCPVCLSPFSTIEFHRHHALFEDDPDNKRCEICGQNFVNRQAHSKHMREDHKVPAKESAKRKRDSIPKKQLVPEDCENLVVETKVETGGASGEMTLFTCKICQKNFKTKDFAKFHILFAHKEDAFTRALCKQCNATFVDARTLRKHIQVHHGELRRIICPFCEKPFSSRMQGFRLHLSNVHPGLTYKPEELRIITGTTQDEIFCKLCSKFFKTEQGLKEHMTGKHFSAHFSTFCELCGLQLNPLYKFKHMRYHAEAEQQAGEGETEAAISTIESEAGASSSTTPRRINAQSAKFDVTQLIDVMHYIITTSAKRPPPPRTRHSNSNGRRGERSVGRRVTYRELSSGDSGNDYGQSDYEEDVDYYSDESLGDLIITPEGTKTRSKPGPYSKTRGVRKAPESKAKRKLVLDEETGPVIPYIDLDYDRRLVLELKRCDKAAARYASLRRARIKKERDMKKKKAEQKKKELERKERLLKKKREIERKRKEEEQVELAFAAEVGNYFAIQGQAEELEEMEEPTLPSIPTPTPEIPIAPIPVSVIQPPLAAATTTGWDQSGFPVNIKTEPDDEDDFHVFAVECDVEVDPLEPSTSAPIPMEN